MNAPSDLSDEIKTLVTMMAKVGSCHSPSFSPDVARLALISEEEYDRLVEILNSLILIVREDEEHPLASLMDVIGTLIEKYEDDHVPELDA